ncbi:MAG: hypothetical protein NUV74_13320 [Candidatus Brocadiaceae bacterium]|nr:hypothetical protein [Candidatus Brocadiaceae bacterium]
MARREWKWTEGQLDKLSKVKEILNELQEYVPLTLRQIYYQLVGKGYIENNKSQYGMLSNLLKWARIDGHISWDILEDRTRSFHNLTGWSSSSSFISASLAHFLGGYSRDLLQTQEKYLEIWIEKDALSTVFTKIAEKYTIPVVVCKGFSSISFLNDFKERLDVRQDKQPLALYFGDFDPSGVEMSTAMETTLNDEMGVNGIKFKRIALTQEDIHTYKLPHSPHALKHTDTRAKKHIIAYGEVAVELDALRPDVLESKIKDAIEDEIDIDAFNTEVEEQNGEFDKLNTLKERVEEFVSTNY